MFKDPFSFNGRIRRTEYGLTFIIYIVSVFLMRFFVGWIAPSHTIASLLLVILYFPLLWFLFAQGSKRSHDLGNSGWYQLIPLYGFWLLFADGEQRQNSYGANPKDIGNFTEIEEIGSHLSK